MRIAIGSGGGFCMESFVKVGRSSMSACLKGSPPPLQYFLPHTNQNLFRTSLYGNKNLGFFVDNCRKNREP